MQQRPAPAYHADSVVVAEHVVRQRLHDALGRLWQDWARTQQVGDRFLQQPPQQQRQLHQGGLQLQLRLLLDLRQQGGDTRTFHSWSSGAAATHTYRGQQIACSEQLPQQQRQLHHGGLQLLLLLDL